MVKNLGPQREGQSKVDEVEPVPHRNLRGIDVPDFGSWLRSLRDASVRPTSSPRRAEVDSTAVEHRFLRLLLNIVPGKDGIPQSTQRHARLSFPSGALLWP